MKRDKMETVKYKNNKYIKLNGTWFIIGENDPNVVTIGHFAKLKHQEIIDKLEEMTKEN
jgi:hypothetical protein